MKWNNRIIIRWLLQGNRNYKQIMFLPYCLKFKLFTFLCFNIQSLNLFFEVWLFSFKYLVWVKIGKKKSKVCWKFQLSLTNRNWELRDALSEIQMLCDYSNQIIRRIIPKNGRYMQAAFLASYCLTWLFSIPVIFLHFA